MPASFLHFRPLRTARPPADGSGSLTLRTLPGCASTTRARLHSRREGTTSVAVKIRLMRVGKKKQPTYRVVVADGRSPRDERFIEIIGQYAPRQDPSYCQIDA